MNEKANWKTKILILGGTAGALLGLAAAFLFIKNQPEDNHPRKISSKDGMNISLGLVSLLKHVADIGKK